MAATKTTINGLSPKAERVIRAFSLIAVFGLAIGAAILSFSGLQDLALHHGFPKALAWILPIIVDGMVLTGSLGVVSSSLAGAKVWYSWTITAIGVAFSVWGNAASAPNDIVSQIVHIIPPLTFALSIEGLLQIYRAGAHATAHREHLREQAELRLEAQEQKRLERLERNARVAETSTAKVAKTSPLVASSRIQNGEPQKTLEGSSNIVTSRDRVKAYLTENPEATGGETARALNLDPSYTRKVIRDLKAAALPQLET